MTQRGCTSSIAAAPFGLTSFTAGQLMALRPSRHHLEHAKNFFMRRPCPPALQQMNAYAAALSTSTEDRKGTNPMNKRTPLHGNYALVSSRPLHAQTSPCMCWARNAARGSSSCQAACSCCVGPNPPPDKELSGNSRHLATCRHHRLITCVCQRYGWQQPALASRALGMLLCLAKACRSGIARCMHLSSHGQGWSVSACHCTWCRHALRQGKHPGSWLP